MEKLWAPWRMEYITNADKENGCIFCNCLNGTDDKSNLILCRSELAFIIMNKYPYNNGHLMVVPNHHLGEFSGLSDDEHKELGNLIQLSISVLSETMQPQGFNIGMNLGRVAGAGIEDHLHYHVVPRWNGDTNFMPILGETKVVSEALNKSYDRLKTVIDTITKGLK